MLLRLVIVTAFFAKGECGFRLINQNGTTITWAEEGLLLYNGGTVTYHLFNSYAGDVICKDMGFPYHGSWRYAYIWPTLQLTYPVTLTYVDCPSSASYWTDCKFHHRSSCDHSQDIFLRCAGTTVSCPPGQYRYSPSSSGGYCQPCPATRYKSNEGPDPLCKRCPGNTVSTTDGTYCNCTAGTFWKEPNCWKCPPTSSSVSGSQHCNCSAGSFWDVKTSACLSCPAGTTSLEGSFRCHPCPEGSESLDGGKSCSCPSGMIWKGDEEFWSPCQKCPANTYKSEEMSNCVPCPPTTSSFEGSDHCSCKAGMYWNTTHSHCDICKSGSVSREGSVRCQKCPPGSNVTHNNEDCTCPSGISWGWDEDGVGSCQRFPSDKGTTSAEILGALTGILMILCLVQGYFLIRKTKHWMVLRERISCFLPGLKKENTPDIEEIPSVVYNATAGACTADQHNDGEGKSTSRDGGEFDNIYGKVQSEKA